MDHLLLCELSTFLCPCILHVSGIRKHHRFPINEGIKRYFPSLFLSSSLEVRNPSELAVTKQQSPLPLYIYISYLWNVFPFQVVVVALMRPENGPMRIFWLIATDPEAGNLDRFLSGRTKCVPVRGLWAIFLHALTTRTLEKFADCEKTKTRTWWMQTGREIRYYFLWCGNKNGGWRGFIMRVKMTRGLMEATAVYGLFSCGKSCLFYYSYCVRAAARMDRSHLGFNWNWV